MSAQQPRLSGTKNKPVKHIGNPSAACTAGRHRECYKLDCPCGCHKIARLQ